jgi:hypothetical protein
MNAKELFRSLTKFDQTERPLYWEFGYWPRTLHNWWREGLSSDGTLDQESIHTVPTIYGEAHTWQVGKTRDSDVHREFGFDQGYYRLPVNVGLCPTFEKRVLEVRGDMRVVQDEFGGRQVEKTDGESIPQYLCWVVRTRSDFGKLKETRLRKDLEGRLPPEWPSLVRQARQWEGPVVLGGYPYGFFGYPRFLMGAENLLVSFYSDPDLIRSMVDHLVDLWVFTYERVLSDIRVDALHIWEDMCFKTGPLISPDFFRVFLLPAYKRLTSFLREHGIDNIFVDTDGDCSLLIPLFIEAGVTGIYPFECASGMNIVKVRREYPGLVIMGGLDKRAMAKGKRAIDQELEEKLPVMFKHRGYIPFCDHLVPPDVSFSDFGYYRKRIVELSEWYW